MRILQVKYSAKRTIDEKIDFPVGTISHEVTILSKNFKIKIAKYVLQSLCVKYKPVAKALAGSRTRLSDRYWRCR